MHTEPTGRDPHETREVYDVAHCSGCGGRLAHPHIRIGWLQCSCAGTAGHRTWWCLDCEAWTFDPPHDESQTPEPGHGGSG